LFGLIPEPLTMPTPISGDLKARIPILQYQQGLPVKDISRLLGIRKTLIYDTLEYYRHYRMIHNPEINHPTGRPCILDHTDIQFIKATIAHRRCIYLDELQQELLEKRGVRASIATLSRTLRRLLISRKRVSIWALERNDIMRSAFMNMIATTVPDPEMFIFIDEAAKNKRTEGRSMGWAMMGQRCVQRRCFVRGQRFSILPALTLDGIITYDIIEGSVTAARFLQFLRELVVSFPSSSPHLLLISTHQLPLTNPYPGPRSVIVLDNCSIHHAEAIRCLVEDEARKQSEQQVLSMLTSFTVCKLIFLPPYSPDLNPIEQAFSSIKSYIRRNWHSGSLTVMDRACQNITPEKAAAYFQASGYIV
jgi:transposase